MADPEKARPGVEALIEFMIKLTGDIMDHFSPRELPPLDKVTQRDPEEIEALPKGPLKGGKHIYTVAYPP